MLNIKILQIKSSSNLDKNLKKIKNFISKSPADLLLLPELALTSYNFNFYSCSQKKIDSILKEIQKIINPEQILLIGAPYYKEHKIYNSIYFLTDKQIKVVAEKMLLFPELDNSFYAGNCRELLKIKNYTLGIVICFELRSPEIARNLIKQGADVIIVFAQWPIERIDHWQTLLKARAIENQCYILGINALGNSAIFSPEGKLLNTLSLKETVIDFCLEKSSKKLNYPLKTPYLNFNKVFPLELLSKIIKKRKEKGQITVFTNGCFDILHAGHVDYLQKARLLGDLLIVGLNSDFSIKKIKGNSRPVNSQILRASVLSALECVDYITIFDEETPEKLIKTLKPDILVKGADWQEDKIVGADFVKSYGGKVVRIEFNYNISTTQIIQKIKQFH